MEPAMTRLDRFLNAPSPWLADGGLETAMIYHEGLDLPLFAAFPLVGTAPGRVALTRYFAHFLRLTREARTGFVLDTATWRANMGWAPGLGLDAAAIRQANLDAVAFAMGLRDSHETAALPILVNGAVGPSGDGYRIETALRPDEAQALHQVQVDALAEAGADLVTAVTMTHSGEAIGIARAARRNGLPHVLSFTVETDGRLPCGQDLHEALAETEFETDASALFYMVNCAHPAHFLPALAGPLGHRIGGLRGNASRQSHAELDAAATLDDGDPREFGALYAEAARLLPGLRLIGGCCGTDHRHVGAACGHLHARAA
jgi:S-methylmethionine-dependent homocysteine/selenocysteine methylase